MKIDGKEGKEMNFIGLNKPETGIRKVGVEETLTCNQVAVLFLLDESGSMSGDNIRSLNDAINRFPNDVSANNRFARMNIEIAVMAFSSSVRLVSDWTPLGNFSPVSLSADGGTNLEVALEAALRKVKDKLADSSCDISHIVLISDGCGGSVTSASHEISKMKNDGTLVFWMLGVPGYDTATAQELTKGERLYLLKSGKQFDYSDFITMLANAVIKIQSGNQNPVLQTVPEAKRLGSKQNGINQPNDNCAGDGILGNGNFGGGLFGSNSKGGRFGG